jgi:hypothetical protein
VNPADAILIIQGIRELTSLYQQISAGDRPLTAEERQILQNILDRAKAAWESGDPNALPTPVKPPPSG